MTDLLAQTADRLDLASTLGGERPDTPQARTTVARWWRTLANDAPALRGPAEAIEQTLDTERILRLRSRLQRFRWPLDACQALDEGLPLTVPQAFALTEAALQLRALRTLLEPLATTFDLCAQLSWTPALWPPGTEPGPFRLDDTFSRALANARETLRVRLEADAAQRNAARQALETEYGQQLVGTEAIDLPDDHPRATDARSDLRLCFQARSSDGTVYRITHEPDPTLEAARHAVDVEEEAVLHTISHRLRDQRDALEQDLRTVERLDLALFCVRLRQRWSGCWPTTGDALHLVEASLPDGQTHAEAEGRAWHPHSLTLHSGVTALTGANMGGKSTTLRLVGVIGALAHLGLPVPAREAVVPAYVALRMLGVASGKPEAGLSRFGEEVEALRALFALPAPSLLLLDEIAGGTNPAESEAVVCATAEALARTDHTVLMATHIDAIHTVPGIGFLHLRGLDGVDPETLQTSARALGWAAALRLHLRYELREGPARCAREALRIAELAGLPAPLLHAARKRLDATQPPPRDPHATSEKPS